MILCTISCSKGYELRVSNYYTAGMDSVIIGNKAVVFTNLGMETATDYRKIGKGNHTVRFVPHMQEPFYGVVSIPGSGDGRLTVQVDAIKQVSVLED